MQVDYSVTADSYTLVACKKDLMCELFSGTFSGPCVLCSLVEACVLLFSSATFENSPFDPNTKALTQTSETERGGERKGKTETQRQTDRGISFLR